MACSMAWTSKLRKEGVIEGGKDQALSLLLLLFLIVEHQTSDRNLFTKPKFR